MMSGDHISTRGGASLPLGLANLPPKHIDSFENPLFKWRSISGLGEKAAGGLPASCWAGATPRGGGAFDPKKW